MKHTYILLIVLVLSFSCSGSGKKSDDVFMAEQIILPGIAKDKFDIEVTETELLVKDTLKKLRGRAIYPDENLYYVCFPLGGFLKTVKKKEGDRIKPGDLLAVIEHPDFLDLKTDYLKAKYEFEFFRNDFARQGEMAIEHATSLKKMQVSERNYKESEVILNALKSKLKLIGIDPQRVTEETLTPVAFLYSPIGGTISKLNATEGKYFKESEEIFQVIKNRALIARFILDNGAGRNFVASDILKFSYYTDTVWNSRISEEKVTDKGRVLTVKIPEGIVKEEGEFVELYLPVNDTLLALPLEAVLNNKWVIVHYHENLYRAKEIKGIKIEGERLLVKYDPELYGKQIVVKGAKQIISAQ